MYFHALAVDFDGTLATDGQVFPETLTSLERLKASGRKLLLITGRELPHLQATFPGYGLFDLIVAENGALLYDPKTDAEELLAAAADGGFAERLRAAGVAPLSVGRSIVATWEPHDPAVLEAIRDSGLELTITYNKGAIMVLPTNVNKATGGLAALQRLGISPHNMVGVGDAENDQAFLALAGLGVAVANAIPALQERVDLVTQAPRGAGVGELIDRLLANDLADVAQRPDELIFIANEAGETKAALSAKGEALLVAGTSGGGKTTIVTRLLEIMIERRFQVVIVDPEGDYSGLRGVTEVGGVKEAPSIASIAELISAGISLSINLLALPMDTRPQFHLEVLRHVVRIRENVGRPHWLVVDEAHHVMPADWDKSNLPLEGNFPSMLMVTLDPQEIHRSALSRVTAGLAVGGSVPSTVKALARAMGLDLSPGDIPGRLPKRQGYLVRRDGTLDHVVIDNPVSDLKRHVRKYAEGDLGPDRSFYFRGPDGDLNLRAQNLSMFLQMADGVDATTWTYHLERGDVVDWFKVGIKDAELAEAAAAVAADRSLDPIGSRAAIGQLVNERYMAAAKSKVFKD